MRVNTNIDALNGQRNLAITAASFSKSVERLSSGLRINRAGDDAAGLSISEKLRGQVKGLNQAVRNAQDGSSLIQTAEGALNEAHSILQRMRELTVQAANDTLTTSDRTAIASELDSLNTEINRIATTTRFNTKTLLTGSFNAAVNTATSEILEGEVLGTAKVAIGDMQTTATGFGQTATFATLNAGVTAFVAGPTQAIAEDLLDNIDDALADVSGQRSALGACQNRLEHTIANLNVSSENLAASESRIRDVDMAAEMVSFTRSSILQQAGTAILAQANQAPNGVLSLLR